MYRRNARFLEASRKILLHGGHKAVAEIWNRKPKQILNYYHEYGYLSVRRVFSLFLWAATFLMSHPFIKFYSFNKSHISIESNCKMLKWMRSSIFKIPWYLWKKKRSQSFLTHWALRNVTVYLIGISSEYIPESTLMFQDFILEP